MSVLKPTAKLRLSLLRLLDAKLSRKCPMGLGIPPLTSKTLLEPKPLKSGILVRRLAVLLHTRGERGLITGFQTGSGQTGFSQKGHISLHFAICCYKCAHVVACCSSLSRFAMLPHVAHVFLRRFISGNCGTSATTPSVPTPSGSFQEQP